MKTGDKKTLIARKRYIVGIIRALKENTAALLAGCEDGEHLHDLRVAIRRLQAISALFEKTLGYEFDDGFKLLLKSLISTSSKLRDIEEFEFFTKQEHKGGQKKELKDAFLYLLSDSLLWRRALSEYLKLFSEVSLGADFHKKSLETIIDTIKDSSRKYGKLISISPYDLDGLHKVRKHCKICRYQLDFVFMQTNEGSLICKQMQEKLGVVNDFRIWLEMADADNFDDSIKSSLKDGLREAIHDMRVDGNMFASQKYRSHLFDTLRQRLSML